ncbi:hypothetical protein OGAPHI_003675 [Ogataea philodendri]|uniref:Uncharacterized protein n=1 Tax=Ogataea philodendri TaxID=1378263 RepID=A0A9P8P6D3_9ASCO|nr:uncharacterized protein OGAPHI_003675 [Ogataea philodendri]KAH3665489.1 hypothetical protein OGAPHI_003675 [Ogataea philodendri]
MPKFRPRVESSNGHRLSRNTAVQSPHDGSSPAQSAAKSPAATTDCQIVPTSAPNPSSRTLRSQMRCSPQRRAAVPVRAQTDSGPLWQTPHGPGPTAPRSAV